MCGFIWFVDFTVCVVGRLSHEVGWKYKVREVMKAGVGVVYEDRVTCETGLVFCVCYSS